MKTDKVIEIGIDTENQLYIKPKNSTFPEINGINGDLKWNPDLKVIHAPKPGEFSYLMWYSQIIKAAKKQGYTLEVDSDTRWVNMTDEVMRDVGIIAGYKVK